MFCLLVCCVCVYIQFKTVDPKKPKVTVSYPGAMLNIMVQVSNRSLVCNNNNGIMHDSYCIMVLWYYGIIMVIVLIMVS